MLMQQKYVGKFFRSDYLIFLMIVIALSCIYGCSSGGGGGEKEGYALTGYDGVNGTAGNDSLTFNAAFPWFVNLTFQAQDENGWGYSGLGQDDIQLFEDDKEIDKNITELNIRQRHSLPPDCTYTLKTVLLLDNSPSAAADLDKIKEAAQVVIDNLDEKRQQQIAIVAFDSTGEPVVVEGFTNDTTQLYRALALGTTDSIQPSYGSSNFYGAVIKALSLWDNSHTPAKNDFEQGFVVAITDGKDTTGLYKVSDAIAKRGGKQVITVPVGVTIPENYLSDLEQLGNAGYYHVTDPYIEADEKVDKKENLCETLLVIQNRMIAYADAFYWVQYVSSCTSQDQNLTHSVLLSIVNNANGDTGSTVSGTFNSKDFFSGTSNIYFNATASDPDGIEQTTIYVDPGQSNATTSLSAITYSRDSSNPSQFEWSSSNQNIFTVKVDDKDTSKCTVTAVAPGNAVIIVKDTANNTQRNFTITVQIKSPSYEFVRYAIQSAAPWFVDATFNIRKTDPQNNQWEWVTNMLREDFLVLENDIKIDLEKSEINIRKRDNIPSDYAYSLKTVLLIDNSPSIVNPGNLGLMKEAAKAFVKRALVNDPDDDSDPGPLLDAKEEFQQEIAIVTFTEDGDSTVWIGFSNDIDALNIAIDSIPRGFGPSDFYGGMLDALHLWNDDLYPRDANTQLTQGVVVAVTDGFDTFTGFHTADEVLEEIGNKQVITVGVGDDIVSSVSEKLVEFGIAGFYSVAAPGKTMEVVLKTDKDPSKTKEVIYTELQKILMDIQEEIVEFANSFYWLNYKSYVVLNDSWIEDCDARENLKISINDNANTGSGSSFSGKFISCRFFYGNDNQIYVNAKPSNPWGINEVELKFVDLAGIDLINPSFDLEAFTYNHVNKPSYRWVSANQNLVLVDVDQNSYGQSMATLYLPQNKKEGSTYLNITDVANMNSFKQLAVNVKGIWLAPILYYPFDNGSADDFSGRNNHGVKYGTKTAADRFGNPNSALYFDGFDDYIAIRNLHYGNDASAYGNSIDEITVCAWVNVGFNFLSSKLAQIIISFDRSEYWRLSVQDDIGVNVTWGTTPDKSLASPDSYIDGKWHFICGWFKKSGGAYPDKKLYIDGELIASANSYDGKPFGKGTTRYGFIGTGSEATEFNGEKNNIENSGFRGTLDDVMIFPKALTEEEIKILYHLHDWDIDK